jgi:hypothetical protein
MNKKALIIQKTSSFVAEHDANAIKNLYEFAGFQTELINSFVEFERKYELLDISSYDAIVMPSCCNALFESGRGRRKLYKELKNKAKPGSLTIYVCDITYSLDFRCWDKGEDPKSNKINELKNEKIKILGSFNEKIQNDETALDLIKKKWMKEFPNGTFYPIQWLLFGDDWYLKNKRQLSKTKSLFSLNNNEKYRYLYYGVDKSKIANGLKELGFGSPEDLSVGKIKKFFPECSTLTDENPGIWVDYIDKVEKVLVPYERIKGDYQYTLRYTECFYHYRNKALISEKIPEEMRELIINPVARKKEKDRNAEKLKKLYI